MKTKKETTAKMDKAEITYTLTHTNNENKNKMKINMQKNEHEKWHDKGNKKHVNE